MCVCVWVGGYEGWVELRRTPEHKERIDLVTLFPNVPLMPLCHQAMEDPELPSGAGEEAEAFSVEES